VALELTVTLFLAYISVVVWCLGGALFCLYKWGMLEHLPRFLAYVRKLSMHCAFLLI
jgi:hypothetical protein